MSEKVPLSFTLDVRVILCVETAEEYGRRLDSVVSDLEAMERCRFNGDASLMRDLVDALESLANVSKRMRAFTRANPREDDDDAGHEG